MSTLAPVLQQAAVLLSDDGTPNGIRVAKMFVATSLPCSLPEAQSHIDSILAAPAASQPGLQEPALQPAHAALVQPDADGKFPTPLDGALFMASLGIPQTPLRARTKIAFLPEFQKSATVDAVQIRKWAEEYPGCNFGSVGREGEFFTFEADSTEVRKRFESTGGKFTSTLIVASRPGRGHRWYRSTPAVKNIGQAYTKHGDFSVRALNQYCCSPGSVHPDTGEQYRLIGVGAPQFPSAEEITFWESERVAKNSNEKQEIPRNERGKVVHGKIHGFMLHEAGKMRNIGLTQEEIETALLRKVHEECEAPINDNKVRAMAKSICIYPPGEDKSILLSQGPQSLIVPEGTAPIAQEADPIPPFDPTVVNGIYKKFVDVATRGTTMAPQFVYAIAKTVVGARMAGKVKFENLDVEPRFYTALIGETGSGKGEAWRRVFQILNCEAQIGNVSKLKIINSADSGAGIRDAFFEPPEEAPMLMYIDEVESFGNKAAATRNPAIMDMLIELADGTHISSVKASRGKSKGMKTKNDARLCAVMCGQEGSVYMKAFAGRTKLGLWDRLTPEYSVPVEAGDLPHISTADSFQLLNELNKLDYSGVMTMSDDAKTRLEIFWSEQPAAVRKKARWKKNLTLDAYMSAFGRGVKVAEVEDVEIAIRIFTRQLIIRQTHFTSEVPDRVGYYIGLLKAITAKMERQLAAGVPEGLAAKSRRDFEKESHAHRDNETHIFEKAWHVYSATWLEKREVTKANGQKYWKYLPATDE
jgi:Bifunctional DNA primase/polymerase, N-terminal